jgi:hypothetical protein
MLVSQSHSPQDYRVADICICGAWNYGCRIPMGKVVTHEILTRCMTRF